MHPSAKAGELIVRIIPPTLGEAGVDVFGKTIPPHAGRAVTLKAGENVEELEAGALFRATDSGLVLIEKGLVSVTQCLTIKGDVGLSTGNVRTDTGSIRVMGSVQTGSSVDSSKHLVVGEVVESADVTAGGDIEVAGGIMMPDGGLIKAEGTVRAQFAVNANIEAGGDVIFAHEANHCLIRAKGRIVALKGRGIVQGGCLVCGKGMEVNELGSELGVTTTVVVESGGGIDDSLEREKLNARRVVDRIDQVLGKAPATTILEHTPAARRKEVAKALLLRSRAVTRIKALDKLILEGIKKASGEVSRVRIKVLRRLHPGVVVKFAGKTLAVEAGRERCQIRWDETQDRPIIDDL
ncbi:MAG: DUF342 domain-containing protein [Desulfovibrionaceae bacterium]|nr:DUF342 domain-containing protein [Desulfovibrionaceae bacterium]